MNTNILDFGAKGDGVTLCTEKIQMAIDACASSGGGRVSIPAGTFLTGTLWLRDNVELHLEHGSVLKGSTNMDDYNALDAYAQNFSSPVNERWLGKHLIIALECKNVALTGTGMIDGSADAFLQAEATVFHSIYVWRCRYQTAKDDEILRPGQLVCFIECERVLVENITLTNQPCWGCFLHGCDYVTVRGLKVKNPETYVNSDGLDIDCCRFVTVSDCIIDTGDDAIAIRANEPRLKNTPHPCEHITVTNCVLGSSACGIRIGVGVGAIRHVRISNLTVTRAAPVITFMSSYCGHGKVSIEDVIVSNVSAVNLPQAFSILEGADASVRNIVLENFIIETDGFFNLRSDFEHSVSNVTLRNWDVTLIKGPMPTTQKDMTRRGKAWFRAKNINNLKLENFVVHDADEYLSTWEDGAFVFDCCDDRKLIDVKVEEN